MSITKARQKDWDIPELSNGYNPCEQWANINRIYMSGCITFDREKKYGIAFYPKLYSLMTSERN